MPLTAADSIISVSSGWRVRRVAISGLLTLFTVVALVVATGCGGSGKPAYCSDRSNLENAVKGLPSSVSTGGASGLRAQVTILENDARKLVSSAKSDFPSQTSAMKSSVDSLKTAVQGLPASPTASDLAPIATAATAAVNTVNAFTSATKSKCD